MKMQILAESSADIESLVLAASRQLIADGRQPTANCHFEGFRNANISS